MMRKFALILLLAPLFIGTSQFAVAQSDICPLLIGSQMPDVKLSSSEGETVELRKLTAAKPTVIIFYRGSWCPYCNRHFKEIQDVEGELKEMGYTILAISPDKPENVLGTEEKHELAYSVYSDSDMEASDAFGLSFTVDDETVTKYKKWDIDLEAASGRTHGKLPVPAVFVAGKDGRMKFSYVNPDYHERLGGQVLVAAAKAALEKK